MLLSNVSFQCYVKYLNAGGDEGRRGTKDVSWSEKKPANKE
jgi:hypothetical protein